MGVMLYDIIARPLLSEWRRKKVRKEDEPKTQTKTNYTKPSAG